MTEQGSPAEFEKLTKKSKLHSIIKFLLDVLLLMAVFYAGSIYGDLVFNSDCPDFDVVQRCYANTNQGIMTWEDYNLIKQNESQVPEIIINIEGNNTEEFNVTIS